MCVMHIPTHIYVHIYTCAHIDMYLYTCANIHTTFNCYLLKICVIIIVCFMSPGMSLSNIKKWHVSLKSPINRATHPYTKEEMLLLLYKLGVSVLFVAFIPRISHLKYICTHAFFSATCGKKFFQKEYKKEKKLKSWKRCLCKCF